MQAKIESMVGASQLETKMGLSPMKAKKMQTIPFFDLKEGLFAQNLECQILEKIKELIWPIAVKQQRCDENFDTANHRMYLMKSRYDEMHAAMKR